MLNLVNIYKTYNPNSIHEKVLFSGFNLDVIDGEFVAIIGSNGSGKTSILNLISGDLSLDKGEIILNSANLNKLPNYKRAQKIGRVFQNPSMGTCPSMTIFENLSIADNKLKPYNLTKGLNTRRKDFYRTQLEQLGMGLEDRMNALASNLSGGQRQALALIMATMVTPDLLLLDEHTAALDPKSSDIVMELTQKIVSDKNITTLMVTHNLRYAVDYGTRSIMMHEGNIVSDFKDEEKQNQKISDLLKIFNEISIECGN